MERREITNIDRRESIILCAHTHIPRTVYLPTGQIIINPGSVGLPAYTDDYPYPHGMESGSLYANYAVLSKKSEQWMIEHISVPYDWRTAAKRAFDNGREDWAKWIESGRV
ncbi:hypothetical protein [Aneurinibacillus terranovensis]|uniref:metallophosphoesterase family protein n=1 Tax=Aneurinibacillus terranovensis TaxID=278991 RepID=UPI0012DD7C92